MIEIVRATSIRQIGEASALRYDVCVEVMPMRGIANSARREITPYDVLSRTHHLMAYDGLEAVGTLRVILPRSRAESESRSTYGLSMEDSVSFSLVPPGWKVCEIGRFAVRPAYRGTDVTRLIYRELYGILKDNDIDYFGGCALMSTNDIADADRCFDILQKRGLCTNGIWVSPSGAPEPAASGPASARADEEIAEDAEFLSLPALVRYYLRASFRVCGRPFYDDRYDRCFLPMISEPDSLRFVRFAGRTILD
ncbi:GNAT family N-acetyltransferase [Methylorubrum sp. SB2]|uniref:GNAT family N-acetyltransferase n=1 Tax=Methylorubrum subtropicum TaxID=3138812 RepID=UPI00313C91C7